MGMDQWLVAKTKAREFKEDEHTGVCSGLFGMIPTTIADKIEIGYWRKAYDQDQLISDIVHVNYNEGTALVTREQVDEILTEAKRILSEHVFDEEDGNDLTEDDFKFDSDYYTWMSKKKWEDTIKFFEEAKKIYEEDPEAEIYYHVWF